MFVSVVIARGIIAEVQRQGRNADALLAEISLDNALLADLRVRITAQQLDRLVTGAMALTRDPGLGLSLGVRAPDAMLQLVGHLLLSCDTLRAAAEVFQRFSSLLVDDLRMSMLEVRDEVHLTFGFHSAVAPNSARFGADSMLSMVHRIAQRFVPNVQALEIVFQHEAPGYESRYEALWGVRPRFNGEINGLVYPRAMLDIRQPYSDDTMRHVLSETAEQFVVEQQSRLALADRVRLLLRYESDLCNVDASRIAREVGLTHRALRRKLAAAGTSMTLLVEQARERVAREELGRPDSCIKQTAERLGYSEPSAFHRAFKRWTGQTPAEYTRLQQQHAGP